MSNENSSNDSVDKFNQQLSEKLKISENDTTTLVQVKKHTDDCHKVLVTKELLLRIFCALPIRTVLKMRLVNRLWDAILQDDHTWRKIHESKFDSIPHSLFQNKQSYKTICLYKEYQESDLWTSVINSLDPASSTLLKYSLFSDQSFINPYSYDILGCKFVSNYIAIAIMSQKRMVIDERNGDISLINERPTMSNVDFNLVPNIQVEVYIKILSLNVKSQLDISLDTQLLTVTPGNLNQDLNYIKNIFGIKFGDEHFMYSPDISLGICKIFSYPAHHMINFNVNNPPLLEMFISRNFLITLTDTGIFNLTTLASVNGHYQDSVEVPANARFIIPISDVSIKIHTVGFSQQPKGRITAYHLDSNDFLFVGYINNDEKHVFSAWDLSEIGQYKIFKVGEYEQAIIQYYEILPGKAHSFLIRWKNKNGEYEKNLADNDNQRSHLTPQIFVTCSGGHVLIFQPEDSESVFKKNIDQRFALKKLNLIWKISTGLTSCRIIENSNTLENQFSSNTDWIFISAKQLKGDMKVTVVVQFSVSNPDPKTSIDGTNYGFFSIDNHNPNINNKSNEEVIIYKKIVHRVIFENIPSSGSVLQILLHLPHSLLIVCQRREPDSLKLRPRFTLSVYDYHNSQLVKCLHPSAPFVYLVPKGYFVMAHKPSSRFDVTFVDLANNKYQIKTSGKTPLPKLKPDGSNRLKVNRLSGNKRSKQPKTTKIDKRKSHQSSKIQYSFRDYDIDYDEEALDDNDDNIESDYHEDF
nr:2059_t:CDS:2 [Entrophospora candida]